MLRRSARIVALIAVAALAHAERATPGKLAPGLVVDTLRLANGLDVIFAPDASATNVVVHVRYGGGSSTESAAQNGYTHLVEHLLFLGSVHVKSGEYDQRIDATGGFTGAVVGVDSLTVYEQVPAGALELALFLEAERMAGLVDGITDASVQAARELVLGEYQTSYAPNGYALVEQATRHALWPVGHPNRSGTIGDEAVIKRATRESVRPFVRERIRPGNATLVIAGAFDIAAARERVQTYFGWIPDRRTPRVPHGESPPLRAAVTAHVYDPVPKVVFAYRLPSPHDPDLLTLEVAARILSGSPGAWLDNWLLVKGDARDVQATVVRYADSAELQITVIPSFADREVSTVWIDGIADSIQLLANGKLGMRLAGAITQYETDLLRALESLVVRADLLSQWHGEGENTLATLPARLRAITPEMLHKAAKKWLAATARVVVKGDLR